MQLDLKTILESKVKVRNIFKAQSVAERFSSTRHIPADVFAGITDEIIDIFEEYLPNKTSFNILEVGIGGGRFTLPFTTQLQKRHPGSNLTGFDNSIAMMSQLPEELKSLQSFKYSVHDITQPLPFEKNYFDASISFYVYHCIKKWQLALENVLNTIAEPKLLIFLRERSQWGFYLDNRFTKINVTNKTYRKFWQEYFNLREQISPMPKFDISASDLAMLTSYLKSKGYSHDNKILKTSWNRIVDYREALESIELGLFTKTRVGLDKKQRNQLTNDMKSWLVQNRIDPNIPSGEIPASIEVDIFYL